MESDQIQDRVYWGMNIVARTIGTTTDAFRPTDNTDPINPANRYLRLHAAFQPAGSEARHAAPQVSGLWTGYFDGAYTRPGDYLVQDGLIWFIASQRRLQPILCVQTNRQLSVSRPILTTMVGQSSYGGVASSESLFVNWPASMTLSGTSGRPATDLPTDSPIPLWTVLLPEVPGVNLTVADMITDDLGRISVIIASEQTPLGWRLITKQATT